MMLRPTYLIPVLIVSMPLTARGNLITNGTFDTPVPSNGTGGGWTTSNIDFAGGHETTGGNPGAFFAINDGGDINSDPVIQQTLTGLNVGTQYTVAGDYKVNILEQGRAGESFAVLLDGAAIALFDPPGGVGDWGPFQASFTATNSTHTIGFAAEYNGSDYDYGLDNVTVVPEPGGAAMLMLGAAALTRRRKR